MYLLGYDIGSSSVKASLVEVNTGVVAASGFYPKTEMSIVAVKKGWAEQEPETWWQNIKIITKEILTSSGVKKEEIKAIGITYQMHGLVVVDKDKKVLRSSIIWCDSRAVEIGAKAFDEIGHQTALSTLLNSPGNFTASKLAWVKQNEPELYNKIYKIMLPGDFLAMKLSGEIATTVSGLSEGMFWDFKNNRLSEEVLSHYGISKDLIPEIVPTFGFQAEVSKAAAEELGLEPSTPICYRAGDQPNNAMSLNVLNPGEIAATAGTSGVVYGVNGNINYDPKSRVNSFAHVNHTSDNPRIGVLLCINGTGILNSWVKKNFVKDGVSYQQMNEMADSAPIGSGGISIVPFGNGAERVMENKECGASIHGINFNVHSINHIVRASQEGIVFSFKYGMEIMQQMGMSLNVIRAGYANMFLSKLFRESLSNSTDAVIELYDTDGAAGAAKGAGIGAKIYSDSKEAFATLKKLEVITPDNKTKSQYDEAYSRWKDIINN